MARRKPKGNNYEAIGEWLVDYWDSEGYQNWRTGGMSGNPPDPDLAALKALMDHDAEDDFPFSYDKEHVVRINIPLGPLHSDLQSLKEPLPQSSSYRRELGYVILGGCRR